MKDDYKEFLTENCNRLKYGKCCTLGCLKRCKYEKGKVPPDYNKATCVPYEIFQELKEREVKTMREDGTEKCNIDGHGIYDADFGPCPLCNQDERDAEFMEKEGK